MRGAEAVARVVELDRAACELDAEALFAHGVEVALDELLRSRDASIDRVLVLKVPDENIIARVVGRRACKSCGEAVTRGEASSRCMHRYGRLLVNCPIGVPIPIVQA